MPLSEERATLTDRPVLGTKLHLPRRVAGTSKPAASPTSRVWTESSGGGWSWSRNRLSSAKTYFWRIGSQVGPR
jgi:hypothetical protein